MPFHQSLFQKFQEGKSFLEESLSVLKFLPGEIKETIEERKIFPELLREPLKKFTELLQPETPEEARKMGILSVGEDKFIDVFGAVGGLKVAKVVGKKVGQTAIEKFTQALREAQPLRKAQEKLFTAERRRRVARIAAVGERVSGEKGFFAQLGQLKGPLPKKTFEGVRKIFIQEDIDSLFNSIQATKTLLPLEKIVTKQGLMKMLEGSVPTNHEINLLGEVFPKSLIDIIRSKRPGSSKVMEALGKAFNLPRAVMATLDLSAPLRQGVFLIGRPRQFFPAFKDMFKFAGSEKAYEGLIEGIKARPSHLAMRQSKLALTELGSQLSKREEAFMSNWAEKIPGFGVLARASNRAYSGFLNKLRADTFDDIVRRTKGFGKVLSEKELKDVSKFINSATGRGDLPGFLTGSAPALNAALFSPRLLVSRLNLLNPYFYIKLSGPARREALRSFFSFAGIAGTVLTLADLTPGVEVGKDARSADFGKIKVGDTRYDILGGFQQYLRLAGQLISGEIVSSTTGRTFTLGEGFGLPTRGDIMLRFIESKENPVVSFVASWLSGETFFGEDFDLPTEVIERFIPFVLEDLFELSKERGAEGLLMGIPAIFGVSLQTYGTQELKFGPSLIGEPTAQIRPEQRLARIIREAVLGELPLGPSKGFSVERYFDQLSNFPENEAADIFDKIAKSNPDLAKKIAKVAKERRAGITAKDKDLKAKGVSSGSRADAILENLNKIEDPAKRAELWDEYVRKGIITNEVGRQLKVLMSF